MKNIYDVLRQKEAELQELQKDIEVLRLAARLLAEDEEPARSFPAVRSPSVGDALPPPMVRTSAPAPVVATPPAVRPAASISPVEGYSAARDNSLRQFP